MTMPSVRRDAARLVPLVAVVAILLTLVLTAFAWPAVRSAPRDVPIAVAGPPPVTQQIGAALDRAEPGAFALHVVPDEAAARAAIQNREVYGAIAVGSQAAGSQAAGSQAAGSQAAGSQGPRMLIASAASPAVATALRQVAAGLGTATGRPVPVEDVVPTPQSDPRGAGLAAAALPLALGGIVTAALVSRLVRRKRLRVVAALAATLAGGMITATVLGTWLDAVPGDWWTTTGVVALGMAATALVLLGLDSLAGTPGLGLGAATVVLLGNPLSGLASAPELLPKGWGALGQLLPPGATGTLLRSTSWFDGARAGTPLLVLTCWCAAGLVLLAAGALLARRRGPEPMLEAPVPVHA